MKALFKLLFFSLITSLVVVVPISVGWILFTHHRAVEAQRRFLLRFVSPDDCARIMGESIHGLWPKSWVLNEKGMAVFRSSPLGLPYRPERLPLPQDAGTFTEYSEPRSEVKLRIVLLSLSPRRYLAVGTWALSIFSAPIVLGAIASVFLSVLGSAPSVLWYLRRKARLAEQIILRLQSGDLSARLPIQRLDEIGQFGLKFNRMAEEIESLVGRLKSAEISRIQILEELAHDLRTPLTSILTLFESIAEAKDISAEYVRECSKIAIPEIEYVNRLIQDLFLLAQMNEPSYQVSASEFDLGKLIHEEVTYFRALSDANKVKTYGVEITGSPDPRVWGNRHLIQRLIRNLLLNANRYAARNISVQVESEIGKEWKLTISDDGPGFTESIQDSFGGARPDLRGKTAQSSSLGLGSVIANRIVRLRGGTMRNFNRVAPTGKIEGAVVQIVLPVGQAKAPGERASASRRENLV
jgi:signal transduction histidine kinase